MPTLLLTITMTLAVGLGVQAPNEHLSPMGQIITNRTCNPQEKEMQPFTIAMLPDTQKLSFNATAYNELIEYIVDERDTRNIKMVLHVGDTVDDGGSGSHHSIAETALEQLEGQIPFLIGIGNNDYDDDSGASRTASSFNSAHPLSTYQSYDWFIDDEYPSGESTNVAAKLVLGGKTYLFINIEYLPRAGALTWAQGIVDNNTDADHIIVASHFVLENDGQRGTNQAITDLWDDFITQNSKVRLVLSGHVAGNGTSTKIGTASSVEDGVTRHMLNPQLVSGDNWADGAVVRFYEIDPVTEEVSVTTYNPVNDIQYTTSDNQFTFDLVN